MSIRNDKTTVTREQHERHKRILAALLKQDENRRCCDCGSRGPTWASINLGVFMCLTCSGIHRSLGVHISKVRSATLDTWLPEQIAFIQDMGNARGNTFWEARLPDQFRRPLEQDSLGLSHFIREKYVDRRYACRDYKEPPTIDNYLDHPFMKQAGSDIHPAVADAPRASTPSAKPTQPPAVASHRRAASASSIAAAAPVPSFDLLSLDDPAPTPAHSMPQQADDDWAAFGNVAPTTTGASAVAADEWDAFASAAPPAEMEAATTAALPSAAPSTAIPAAPSAGPADPFALSGLLDAPSSASSVAGSTSTAPSKPTTSVDDILKLYNTLPPQQQQPMFSTATTPATAPAVAAAAMQGVAAQGAAPFMYVQGANGAVYMVPAAAMQQQMAAVQNPQAGMVSMMQGSNHSFSVPNLAAQQGSTATALPPRASKPADPLDSLWT